MASNLISTNFSFAPINNFQDVKKINDSQSGRVKRQVNIGGKIDINGKKYVVLRHKTTKKVQFVPEDVINNQLKNNKTSQKTTTPSQTSTKKDSQKNNNQKDNQKDQIKQMQQQLVDLGYYANNSSKEVDGIIGRRTRAAIEKAKQNGYTLKGYTLSKDTSKSDTKNDNKNSTKSSKKDTTKSSSTTTTTPTTTPTTPASSTPSTTIYDYTPIEISDDLRQSLSQSFFL